MDTKDGLLAALSQALKIAAGEIETEAKTFPEGHGKSSLSGAIIAILQVQGAVDNVINQPYPAPEPAFNIPVTSDVPNGI